MAINFTQKSRVRIGSWFRPTYDELTIYVITLTCILLVISHPGFLEGYYHAWESVRGKETGWLLAISGLAMAGVILSLYHVAVRRKKENWEKTIMASFAMAANGVAGIVSGKEVLPDIWSVQSITPLWNILNGLWLLYQIGLVPEDAITDDDATPLQIVAGTLSVIFVFVVCQRYSHMTWTMTFSLCVAYATVTGSLFRIINLFNDIK